MHGRATKISLAALSLLAERYDEGRGRLSAAEIARERGFPAPFVAKILGELARVGLIEGRRGPGGGYTLARPPEAITLAEVHGVFERAVGDTCPFDGGSCGDAAPCALHGLFGEVRLAMNRILHENTLAVFADGRAPARPPRRKSARTRATRRSPSRRKLAR